METTRLEPDRHALGDTDGGRPDTDRPDGALDPLLRPTREALLARRAHRLPRWKRLLSPGTAGRPAWIRLEADAQAERLGRRTPGTEHVLLALLAVREVSLREPELAPETDVGEPLADLGLGYARAHAALDAGEVTLPADPRSVEAYLADGTADGGTEPLLRALLAEDTRARRLVEALANRGREPHETGRTPGARPLRGAAAASA